MRAFHPRLLWARLRASRYWKDVGWLASGTALVQVIAFATMPVFSRIFRPEDFAVQNLFGQIAGFVAVAATLRYEHFVQLPKGHGDGVRLMQLVAMLGLCATVVLTPFAWLFRATLARWAGDAALAPWLPLIPVTAMGMSMAIAAQGGAQRRGLFRTSSVADVAGKCGSVATVFAGWWLLPGPGGLVLASLGGSVAKVGWLARGIWRAPPGEVAGHFDVLRAYWRMSGGLVVSHVLYACTVAVPAVFIAHAYGSHALGQYGLAFQLVCLPSGLLGSAIGNVYYQRASAKWARGESFGDIWRSTASRLLWVGLPVYVSIALALPTLVPLVFGGAWRPAGRYGSILAASAFFSFLTGPMDRGSIVVGAWWYLPAWHGARAVATGLAAWGASVLHWDMTRFLLLLVGQQMAFYLVDFWIERRFAHRSPPTAPA